MPTPSKISNRVMLTNSIDYNLDNIFKDFENYNPSTEAFTFAKNYFEKFQKEVIKPIHFNSKNNPFFKENLKKFLTNLIKLPFKVFRKFLENSNKLNPTVYRTLDNIRADQVFTNFFSEYYNLLSLLLNIIILKNWIDLLIFLYMFNQNLVPLFAPIFTNLFELIRQIAISLPYGLHL